MRQTLHPPTHSDTTQQVRETHVTGCCHGGENLSTHVGGFERSTNNKHELSGLRLTWSV